MQIKTRDNNKGNNNRNNNNRDDEMWAQNASKTIPIKRQAQGQRGRKREIEREKEGEGVRAKERVRAIQLEIRKQIKEMHAYQKAKGKRQTGQAKKSALRAAIGLRLTMAQIDK